MLNLIKYELKKVFGINKGIFAIITLFGIIAMFVINFLIEQNNHFQKNSFGAIVMGLAFTVLGIFVFVCFAFPLIKSIYTKYYDLNAATAPLESHIPEPGWKKIYAKVITDLVFIVVGFLIALFCFSVFYIIATSANFSQASEIRRAIAGIFQMFPNIVTTFGLYLIIFLGKYVPILAIFSGSAVLNGSLRNRTKFNKSITTVVTIVVLFIWGYIQNLLVDLFTNVPFKDSFKIPLPRNARDIRMGTIHYMEGNEVLVFLVMFIIAFILLYFIGKAMDKYVDL